MSSTDVIRLVGGPPKLDRSVCNLALSANDRADAEGGRFVRATCGSTISALAAVTSRCHDRQSAEQLAATWRAVLYRPCRGLRRRVRTYRFEGKYALEPRRDQEGRWTLRVCDRLAGADPSPPIAPTAIWAAVEQSVDDAAAMFAAIAAQLPEGALADRVAEVRHTVGSCVADAARLCAVGVALGPRSGDVRFAEGTDALIARARVLVERIEDATTHLVRLHLGLDATADPASPLAALADGWTEIAWTDGPATGTATG